MLLFLFLFNWKNFIKNMNIYIVLLFKKFIWKFWFIYIHEINNNIDK